MIEQIRNELLDRGLEDILQLSVIIGVVSIHLGKSPDDRSLLRPTLDVILDLLESGYVVAGQVAKDENDLLYIRSWDMSPSDVVRRIERDWNELGRTPNLGEVVWLELTDSGRAKIRSISNLSADERHLVEQVVARRRPALRGRVPMIGQGKLNWEERKAFHEGLADELAAAEQGSHGDQSEYARKLKDLVDRALVF